MTDHSVIKLKWLGADHITRGTLETQNQTKLVITFNRCWRPGKLQLGGQKSVGDSLVSYHVSNPSVAIRRWKQRRLERLPKV